MLDPVWQHDRDHEDLEQQRPDALDDAERLRESFTREGVGAAGESTGPHTPEGRGCHEVDAPESSRLAGGPVLACSPAASLDPLVRWSEADRVLARERADTLRRVSEPVHVERIRPAESDEPLSAARGILLGLAGGLAAWTVIAAVAWIAGAL